MLIDLHKHMVFVDSKFLVMSWFLGPHSFLGSLSPKWWEPCVINDTALMSQDLNKWHRNQVVKLRFESALLWFLVPRGFFWSFCVAPLLPVPHVHLIRRHTTRIQIRNPSVAFPPSVYTMHCISLPFLLCIITTAAHDTKTIRILFLLCCELNLELCMCQSHNHRVTRPWLKSELQIYKLLLESPGILGLKKVRALEIDILRQGSSHQWCSQESGWTTNPPFLHLEGDKQYANLTGLSPTPLITKHARTTMLTRYLPETQMGIVSGCRAFPI